MSGKCYGGSWTGKEELQCLLGQTRKLCQGIIGVKIWRGWGKENRASVWWWASQTEGGECNSPETGTWEHSWAQPGEQRPEWLKWNEWRDSGRRLGQRSKRLGEGSGWGARFGRTHQQSPSMGICRCLSDCRILPCVFDPDISHWGWIKELAISSGWTPAPFHLNFTMFINLLVCQHCFTDLQGVLRNTLVSRLPSSH